MKANVRAWLAELLTIRDTPEAQARGLAVGWFFGVSAFWGLQIALAVGVCYLVRGNKVIGALMTLVSNPFTTVPLYSLCYLVGRLLVGDAGAPLDFANLQSWEALWAAGPAFLLAILVGTTAVGLVGAVVLYFTSARLLAALGRWHARRQPPAPPPG
ncbi:MAG TPA: DUF2062 domain-containing protein [Myxococcota bacterium]|nr:DUF2062 domain-containing protein [Myxococcota bacterium]HRY93096.1 DUF2062 domain-containing protein [Myxococcota bacterium]HSA22754.1 DUF2062 domain-containing protein [Myxococcota bacterium]